MKPAKPFLPGMRGPDGVTRQPARRTAILGLLEVSEVPGHQGQRGSV